jgi:cytochrome c5
MSFKYWIKGSLTLTLVSALGLAAQQNSTPATTPPVSTAVQKQPPSQPQSEGERVFQQNCWRCHDAPEGFSPRISGTIVRHMRVRASLSQHDEQVLLKFFNP